MKPSSLDDNFVKKKRYIKLLCMQKQYFPDIDFVFLNKINESKGVVCS